MDPSPDNSHEEPLPALEAPMKEKAAFFDSHPESIRPEDLNNLHLWLPGSDYLAMLDHMLDKKPVPSEFDYMHSDLWLGQTSREYAGAVADSFAHLPEIQRALSEYVEGTPFPRDALIPLYLALRKKGYSHYDVNI